MKLKDMNSLLTHEVKDLLHAEKQLVKALPKMAKAASSAKLRTAFEDHLEETKGHVERLETVCEHLGIAARGGMGRAARGARCAMSPPRAPMAPSLTATCVRRPGRD